MDLSLAKKFFFSSKTAITDDFIFRLHYRYTVGLLLISATLIAGNQFFNDKIECLQEKGISNSLVNMQCWAQSTYSVLLDPAREMREKEERDILFLQGVTSIKDGHFVQKRAYYQWVAIVLLIQALVFYIPAFMWKSIEAGRTNTLLKDIRGYVYGPEAETKIKNLAKYLARHPNELSSGLLFTYSCCALLCFVNAFSQILAIGHFLETDFVSLGFRMLKFWLTDETDDPMADLFPLLTKCNISLYGPGGDINYYNNLCVLPLNIFNAKIYAFFWVWLCILNVSSLVYVVYLFAYFYWCRQRGCIFHILVTMGENDKNFSELALSIYESISENDYFLLLLLGKNLSPVNYKILVKAYNDEVDCIVSRSNCQPVDSV